MLRYTVLIAIAFFIGPFQFCHAQKPLLIAAYPDGHTPFMNDSISYIHSNNRQTNINPTTLIEYSGYDTMYTWDRIAKIPMYRNIRSYDKSDSVFTTYFDIYELSTQSWYTDVAFTYTYRPDYLIDHIDNENKAGEKWEILYTYDGAKNLVSKEEYKWDNASNLWIATYSNNYYGYTGGQLTTEKQMYNGIIHNEVWYAYDINGNRVTDSSTYLGVNSFLSRYTHYPNQLTKTKETLLWDSKTNSWLPQNKTLFSYAANNSCTDRVYSNWNIASHKYDTTGRDTFYYNNYDQLIKTQNQTWANGIWSNNGPAYIRKYALPTNIHYSAVEQQNNFSLYPLPCTTYTNLEMNFDKPTSFSIIIFDMQGRMVKQFTDKAEGHYKKNIIVQDMPAGQYMLQVKSSNQTMNTNFTVIR
jgi:hypothetical protein